MEMRVAGSGWKAVSLDWIPALSGRDSRSPTVSATKERFEACATFAGKRDQMGEMGTPATSGLVGFGRSKEMNGWKRASVIRKERLRKY